MRIMVARNLFIVVVLIPSTSMCVVGGKSKSVEIKETKESIIASPQEQLRTAILNNSYEDVIKAIKAGAIINFDSDNKSPLLHALLAQKLTAAEALLKSGANPNINFQGEKLVFHFMLNNDAAPAVILLKYGADYSGIFKEDQDVFTFFLHHYYPVGIHILTELLKKGDDLKPFLTTSKLKNNVWYQALCCGNSTGNMTQIPPVSFFLSNGADINQIFRKSDDTTWTPLLIAIDDYMANINSNKSSKSEAIIRELLEKKADTNKQASPIPNKGRQTALSFLFFRVSNINNPNEYQSSLFNELTRNGANFPEGVHLFLNAGGNPNFVIKTKHDVEWGSFPSGIWSLLGLAVYNQDVKTVQRLLNAGANPNVSSIITQDPSVPKQHKGQEKISALAIALRMNNEKIIELLLEKSQH